MSDFTRRRRKLRDWLDANAVDAMLVTSAANVRYLFGFAGEGMAVVGDSAVFRSFSKRFLVWVAWALLVREQVPGHVRSRNVMNSR